MTTGLVRGLQLDEALLERQREAYAVPGVEEDELVQQPHKRKKGRSEGDIVRDHVPKMMRPLLTNDVAIVEL